MSMLIAMFIVCLCCEDKAFCVTPKEEQRSAHKQRKKPVIKNHIKEEEYKDYRELFAQYEGDILMQRVDRLVWCLQHPDHPHVSETFSVIIDEIREKKFSPYLRGSMEWIKPWRDLRKAKLWIKVHSLIQSVFAGARNANDGVDKLEKALASARAKKTLLKEDVRSTHAQDNCGKC